MPTRHLHHPYIIALPILLFAFTITKNAWVCDDAYITFRTIENFINGYGLTWNVGHRVQSYTHPLWMFLNAVAYALTGEIFFTTLVLSIFLSLTAIYIVATKISATTHSALVALTILLFSHAFTDYASSGLENPLTFVCLAGFFAVYLHQNFEPHDRLFYLSILASLGMLTRLDTALFYIPTLAFTFWPIRNLRSCKLMALGFLPLIAWKIFSIIYYGFPFPNTAYAKLNTGIPTSQLIQQGLYYFADSLFRDPLTLAIIVSSLGIPFFIKQRHLIPLMIGLTAYLLYILKIGGDFMAGRFFAAPLLVSAILFSQLSLRANKQTLPVLASILLIGLVTPNTPLFTTSAFGSDKTKHEFTSNGHGIVDERAYYFPYTGLLNAWLHGGPTHQFVKQGQWLRQNHVAFPMSEGTVGLLAYYAGPDIHFSDIYALTDPLLSRLPVDDTNSWRIGHFQRRAPIGYLKSIQTQTNQIHNKDLAQFYNHLKLITQGDLFTAKRWAAVWHINTGAYKTLLQPQWAYAELKNQVTQLMHQNRIAEAIPPLQKALQIDETQADGWYLLSQLQYTADQIENAHTSILRAIALDGKTIDYRFLHAAIVYAFYADGHTKRATLLFTEALRSAQVSEVYLNIGTLLAELGETDWALETFYKVVNNDMKNARYWFFPNLQSAQHFKNEQKSQALTHIARILINRGEQKKAAHCYQQAVQLNPKNQEATQYLAYRKTTE